MGDKQDAGRMSMNEYDSFIQYTEQARYLVASPVLPVGPPLR